MGGRTRLIQGLETVRHGLKAGKALDRAPAEKAAQPGVIPAIGHRRAEIEEVVLPEPPKAKLCPGRTAAGGQAAGGELIAAAQTGADVYLLLQTGITGGAAGAKL